MSIFDKIGEMFTGPSSTSSINSSDPMPVNKNSMPSANSANSRVPNTRSMSTPTSTLNRFRTRQLPLTKNSTPSTKNSEVTTNTPSSLQSGGKRKMRSKSKSLRPPLFLKHKYKMARRSTMRKGRKGRKGSRRARR